MCVLPVGASPLWDEVQRIMREFEIEHPNKGVENGMHLEMLIADFLAGLRVPPGVRNFSPYS